VLFLIPVAAATTLAGVGPRDYLAGLVRLRAPDAAR
jgi:hypothetical protein